MACLGGRLVLTLANNELVLLLWAIFAQTRETHLRRSCAWALAHLAQLNPAIYQHLVDKVGLAVLLSNVLRDPSSKVRIPFINMCISCIAATEGQAWHQPRLQAALVEHHQLVAHLLSKFDTAGAVLRAKVYLLLGCLVRLNPNMLATVCQRRALSYLEKDNSRHLDPGLPGENYLFAAGGFFMAAMVQAVPAIIAALLVELEHVVDRRHPPSTQLKRLKGRMTPFPAVYQTVASHLTGRSVVSGLLVSQLGALLQRAHAVASRAFEIDGRPLGINEEVLQVALGIAESMLRMLPENESLTEPVMQQLLPALTQLLSAGDFSITLTSLCILQDASGLLHCAPGWTSFTRDVLMPGMVAGQVFAQAEPVPVFAAKVLCTVLENDSDSKSGLRTLIHCGLYDMALASAFQRELSTELTPGLGELLPGMRHLEDSIHVTRLLGLAVAARFVDVLSPLLSQKLAWSLMATLEAAELHVEACVGLLTTLYHVLRESATTAGRALGIKQKAGVGADTSALDRDSVLLGEHALQITLPFLPGVKLMLTRLLVGPAELVLPALHCLALLLQLHSDQYNKLLATNSLNAVAHAFAHGSPRVQALLLKLLQRALAAVPAHIARVQNHPELKNALMKLCQTEDFGTRQSIEASQLSLTLSSARSSVREPLTLAAQARGFVSTVLGFSIA